MKLQEVYDYNGKSDTKMNQKYLFERNLTKVKNVLLIFAFLSICIEIYHVERKSADHKMAK